MTRIHPTALIEPGARLAPDVEVGAYSIIGPHVTIGAGSVVGPHAVVTGRTTLGARNRIFQFAAIGEIPQDRKYGGEPTTTTIGDDNVFREYVTINAGTAQDRGDTAIGNGNLFLAYTHVAHDCVVGDFTTFSNNAQIAGHVVIGDWVVMGAYSGAHQRSRIGEHAMLAAGALLHQDLPPFVIAFGNPAKPHSVNSEGLRRRGFSTADVAAVRRAYKTLYREGLSLEDARTSLAQLAEEAPVIAPLIAFLAEPGRGIIDECPRSSLRSPPTKGAVSALSAGLRALMPDAATRGNRSDVSNAAVTIGVVAGEPSGDTLGAALLHSLRARLPNAQFVGIAGPKMQAAGCTSWYPMETLSVNGLAEAAERVPELLRIRRALVRRFKAERVPVFIGIDSPDFNLGLEHKLKRSGVRTVHFVSPTIWAWRRERIRTIARSVDRILALFPFEPEAYRGSGIKVDFVGHPLAGNAADVGARRAARAQLRIGIAQPVFTLMPGSRLSELAMHGELLLQTAAAIHEARPDARFLVPLATRATRDHFETTCYRLQLEKLPLTVLYGHAEEALRAADVGLIASGTATLEAALARCPHVIFYRTAALSHAIVKRMLLVPWVGLPNVLAGRFVVPELLQDDATVENLTQAALNLYDDTVTRHRLEALFSGLGALLNVDTGNAAAEAVAAELRTAGVAC